MIFFAILGKGFSQYYINIILIECEFWQILKLIFAL